MKSRHTLWIAAAAVVALGALAPAAGRAATAADCTNREQNWAHLLSPQGGQVQASTQAGVLSYTIPGAPSPGVMLSTTGTIQVDMEHQCLSSLRLVVTKDGTATPVYDQSWGTQCAYGTRSEMVPIGLDGGTYHFQLEGTACVIGIHFKYDGHGGLVGDPPLPV